MKLLSALALALVAGTVAPVQANLRAIVQVIHHVPAHFSSALAELPDLNAAPAEDELPALLHHLFRPQQANRWSYPAVERVQQLSAVSADDIWAEVAAFEQEHEQLLEEAEGDEEVTDDYPQCHEVVYETAQHLINGTIEFIETKCSNESLPEQAKKICHFLLEHKEGVAGFITGFAQPYVLAYFYAAGNGSCPLHPFPINSTSISGDLNIGSMNPHSWLLQLVEDHEYEIMSEMYTMQDDSEVAALAPVAASSSEWSGFFRHVLQVDQQQGLQASGNGGDDDDKKCGKCYAKVVSKYIKVVRQLRAKYCDKHKECPYVNKVCSYLDDHQEFEVGLILGALRPFKFAAGYCMGSKQCVPHNVTEMAIEGSFQAVQLML